MITIHSSPYLIYDNQESLNPYVAICYPFSRKIKQIPELESIFLPKNSRGTRKLIDKHVIVHCNELVNLEWTRRLNSIKIQVSICYMYFIYTSKEPMSSFFAYFSRFF